MSSRSSLRLWRSAKRSLVLTALTLSTSAGCAAAAQAPTSPSAAQAAPAAPAPPSAGEAMAEGDSAKAGGAAPAHPADVDASSRPPPARPSSPLAPPRDARATVVAAQTTAERAPAPKPVVFIVYTGHMQLAVPHGGAADAMDQVIDAAESLGGHLAGRTADVVEVKIPSAHFRDGMQKIGKLGEVTASSVSADDVTAEYHDLEVRLENLKATRKRLEEFLAKAASINDMLTVEAQLERVAKEMDVIVGRLRYLKSHTAFSVLSVQISTRPSPAPAVVAKPLAPSVKPPPRSIDLPIPWFKTLGLDKLLILPAKP